MKKKNLTVITYFNNIN